MVDCLGAEKQTSSLFLTKMCVWEVYFCLGMCACCVLCVYILGMCVGYVFMHRCVYDWVCVCMFVS